MFLQDYLKIKMQTNTNESISPCKVSNNNIEQSKLKEESNSILLKKKTNKNKRFLTVKVPKHNKMDGRVMKYNKLVFSQSLSHARKKAINVINLIKYCILIN